MGRSGYNHDDSEDGDCFSTADSRATEPDRDSSRADRLVGLRSLYREIRDMIIALGPRQPEIKLDGSFRSVGDSLNGNPRLAALMATDPVFLIVRRYRYETELDRLDREQLSDKQPDRKESERDDLSEEQRKVLEKVSASLAQYGQVASLVQQFDKYDEPSASRLRSLHNFFEVNKPFGNDKSYYRHKNDLMVLRDMQSDTFIDRTFVHPLLERPGKFLKRLFRDPTHVDSDEHITINDRRKVLMFNTTFAISILLLILVGPIYPLYYLSQIQSRGVMLLGTAFTQIAFVAIFTVFVGLFTTAKRHELFAIATT
ncbi:hypothetical protein EKO27_g7171 [Xylaria grammica]|uniref:DUF6594 domain-containing protein n=1 Tax=Xylaria grammica TaxID=363999 RepID=A0A439D110_9PEZI|nr:hypothetical protein EKO27_g7171 [Xylaria grammica]